MERCQYTSKSRCARPAKSNSFCSAHQKHAIKKEPQEGILYLPIFTYKETYCVGVYSTKEEARYKYIKYIMVEHSEHLKEICNSFTDEFQKKLSSVDDFYNSFFEDEDTRDFWADELSLVIEECKKGELYDFRKFSPWNHDNLFKILNLVIAGKTLDLFKN